MAAADRLSVRQDRDLIAYEAIPICFETSSRLDLDALALGNFIESSIESRLKDYDAIESERPSSLCARYNSTSWTAFSGFLGERRVGGAIVLWQTVDYELLQGKEGVAVLADIRVTPDTRGFGVGSALFEAASKFAGEKGSVELCAETQDVNAGACRFYSAMGCRVQSIEPSAYQCLDEARIIWSLLL